MRSLQRFRFQHLVRTRLWLLPLICVLMGVAAAVALLAIDKGSGYSLVGETVTGSASSAQSILSVASTALVTLTSIVLSLTLVAVQLAMGQFSPRIVRAILHDRRSQLAIGLFIGTFTYSMTVLRDLNGKSSASTPVPGLAVSVDYVLIVCAIVTLVLFVNHIAQSIRVGGLIGLVGDETHRQVDRLHPVARDPVSDPDVVLAPEYGVVVKLHHRTLVALATQSDCLLELVPAMGDFVPRGSSLFRVRGSMSPSLRAAAARAVILGRERNHDFEPAFGIRKLVDVAERSIYSSPFQDPTTAVQAINAIHDVMRTLAMRDFPSGVHRDAEGRPRLIERMLTWDGYVRLAFDELRLAGAGSPQVARRLRAALEDIHTVASPERRPALDHQLLLLDAGIRSRVRGGGRRTGRERRRPAGHRLRAGHHAARRMVRLGRAGPTDAPPGRRGSALSRAGAGSQLGPGRQRLRCVTAPLLGREYNLPRDGSTEQTQRREHPRCRHLHGRACGLWVLA